MNPNPYEAIEIEDEEEYPAKKHNWLSGYLLFGAGHAFWLTLLYFIEDGNLFRPIARIIEQQKYISPKPIMSLFWGLVMCFEIGFVFYLLDDLRSRLGQARNDRPTENTPRCSVEFSSREDEAPTDEKGCHLSSGHAGPHQFIATDGHSWQWEMDLECDCHGCQSDDPDDRCVLYSKIRRSNDRYPLSQSWIEPPTL